jgi:CHAT domain-containing protein
MLPDLLAPRDKPAPTLLGLGEVDFGDVPRGSARSRIATLPGTAVELTGVAETFRKSAPDARVTELRKGLAAEEWVRRSAPRHAYLHFATHGFFAPEGYGQLVSEESEERGLKLAARRDEQPKPAPDPGLLSGLICAHANDPKGSSGEDGILTALEVQDLDLSRVEMVVLSACETGLGRTAGGEGVLGLQRAFHLAGARTAVTSLWKVDDEATRVLMTRFYDNLFAKKMGRVEALAEAQKWMMSEGPRSGFTRGLKLAPKKGERSEERASPYYWAAFVLSGDWR